MTNFPPGTLLVAEMIAAFLAGTGVGLAHFALLRKNIDILLTSSAMARAGAVHAARFVGTSVALYFTARFGALPLLAAAAGVLPARWLVLRRMGNAQ